MLEYRAGVGLADTAPGQIGESVNQSDPVTVIDHGRFLPGSVGAPAYRR